MSWIHEALKRAEFDGSRTLVVPRINPETGREGYVIEKSIELKSHMTVVLDGAHLTMADDVLCPMFMNSFAFLKIGRTKTGLQQDIRIIGKNGATLDGGRYNGLGERTQKDKGKSGLDGVVRNVTIMLHNVENFEIRGLNIVDQRYWAINLVECGYGVVSDLHFALTERVNRSASTTHWRNQDGIDLRIGCHHIKIENLSGETGDDTVALSAFGNPQALSTSDSNLICDFKSQDIHDVSIKHVHTFNNHTAIVRLTTTNARQMYNIDIEDVVDTTPDDYPLDIEDGPRTAVCVKLGEVGYEFKGYQPCRVQPGDLRNITVKGVRSNAFAALNFNGELRDCEIGDVEVGPKGKYALVAGRVVCGKHFWLDNPYNTTHAENVHIRGLKFGSEREGAEETFLHAFTAENFSLEK